MPRFLSPIYVKQEIVTGNETISGNETILGVTSGRTSYWTTVNSELSVSSNLGWFNSLSTFNLSTNNINSYSISANDINSISAIGVIASYQTITGVTIKANKFYGDGSGITGILAEGGYSTDVYKLPLSGGVLTGGLTGTEATFNLISSAVISGTYYGDGSRLTGIVSNGGVASDPTKLPLSGGIITGDLTVLGGITALSGSTFVNTIFTTTSALSIVNTGLGPALYVLQGSGAGDIASFYDGDGIEVLHIGNALNPVSDGVIGIKTSSPNKTLTVVGDISATSNIWGNEFYGNASNLSSIKWDSAYSTVNTNSASWVTTVNLSSNISALQNLTAGFTNTSNTVSTNSAKWESTYSNLNSNSGSWVTTVNLSSNVLALQNLTAGFTSTSNTVNTNSAKWENSYSTVNTNSASWVTTINLSSNVLALQNLTAGFTNTSNTVSTNSAKWESVYSNVNTNSASWTTTVNISTNVLALQNLTAGFTSTSNTVNTNSAKWESVYSNVNSNSATYVTLTGTQTLTNKTVIDWMTLVRGYNTTPTLLATIPSGEVYTYVYTSSPSNITYYRYIATDGTVDAFYTYFSGSTLSGLVASKSITI